MKKYEIGGCCSKGHELTEENTYHRKGSKHQASYLVCRLCKSEQDKAYRKLNKDKIQARQLEWAKENPEKRWKIGKRSQLMRQYGITLEDLNDMFVKQNNKCAICKETKIEPSVKSSKPHWLGLYVDHCHTTGKVRELLCWNCNCALGHFRDDPYRLSNAIDYLSRHRAVDSQDNEALDNS